MSERPVRILSIEDDEAVRNSLRDWLQDSGYEVLTAVNGTQGMARFRELDPDLVLLDMGLPDMPGLAVLGVLHGESPRTPVVIVSANAQIGDAIGAFKAGAWDYVTKPIMNFEALEQTVRNCLERKALLERAERAEQRYRNLLQSLPVVIFTLGPDMSLEFINDSCLDLLGFTPREAMDGEDWLSERIHAEDRPAVVEAFAKACSGRERSFRVGFRFRHKNGYLLHLLAQSLLPSEGGGQCRENGAVSGVISDVTERIFLEKVLVQREKLNTLGAMSHELAHEIRNPLMSLGGFAKRLADRHPDIPEAPIILEQARRLEGLMDRISAYVAPVPVRSQRVDMTEVLTFCLERLAPGLVRRGLDIRPRLDLDLPEVFTDPDLLTDTLANIVNHLAQVMTGESTLIIATRKSPSSVSVEFDLSGPTHESLPRDPDALLMPFEEDGGGLDLALAYRNLKNLGGVLGYTRKEGGGALLTASLPLGNNPGAPDPAFSSPG